MKTIKINLYSPAELWNKFRNWLFWPSRKQCSQWVDVYKDMLHERLICELVDSYFDKGIIGSDLAEKLYFDVHRILVNTSKEMKEEICKPI